MNEIELANYHQFWYLQAYLLKCINCIKIKSVKTVIQKEKS